MAMRKDLTSFMVNKDRIKGSACLPNDWRKDRPWYAGEQLSALRFYLNEKVKILADFMEDDYSGDCFAILVFEDTIVLWRDSFGSCTGCDALEGNNGYEYIKMTLQEGNTRQFDSLEAAKKYIEKTKDYWWGKFPKELFSIC